MDLSPLDPPAPTVTKEELAKAWEGLAAEVLAEEVDEQRGVINRAYARCLRTCADQVRKCLA